MNNRGFMLLDSLISLIIITSTITMYVTIYSTYIELEHKLSEESTNYEQKRVLLYE